MNVPLNGDNGGNDPIKLADICLLPFAFEISLFGKQYPIKLNRTSEIRKSEQEPDW